jgi:hypothetical protein
MSRAITFVLAVLLGAGLTGALAGASFASTSRSAKQFCSDVSKDGGTARFAQAAATGEGAAALAGSLKTLEADAPSKQLKSTVATMAKYFKPIGQGEKINDLGAKNVAKLSAAIASLSTYVAESCGSTGSSSNAASSGGLSGSWSGQYSGASDGTFQLTWQQSGSDLSGTIAISDFGDTPIPINGTVNGGKITFGTVGGLAVTFTGSTSGNSMSGTYHSPAGDGTWNANKTS